MKTGDLVRLLAEDAPVGAPAPMTPRLLAAALAGAALSAALLVSWLGMRPMHEAMHAPSFWMKAVYTILFALSGLLTTAQLSRPGARLGGAIWIAAAAVLWLAVLALMETMRTPASGMTHLWLGWSWKMCAMRIVAFAAPVFAVVLWLMRRMAPTRLALAGAAAGLFAGGVGATIYGLYCEETAAAFVVVWYSLGMAACAVLGAVIGARLLRW